MGWPLPAGLRRCEAGYPNPRDSSGKSRGRAAWDHLLSWCSSGCTCGEELTQEKPELGPGYSLEGMMLKLKLQYFGHLMRRVDSLEKTLVLGGIGGRRGRG